MNRRQTRGILPAAILLTALSSPANAGSIILTGHDTDDHNAFDFMEWAITALMNGGDGSAANQPTTSETSTKIGYIGNFSASLGSYLGDYDNYTFYDLDLTSWTNAFTDGNDVLVIGSGFDFINTTGSTALNSASSLVSSYFNSGGNLFVNTHQGLGSTFYDFLPSIGNVNASNLTTCTMESGSGACMTPSAAGSASGLVMADIVQASITHNQFSPDPVFTVLETYVPTGNAITIGLFDGTIVDGGDDGDSTFQSNTIPEPASLALLGLGLLGLSFARKK